MISLPPDEAPASSIGILRQEGRLKRGKANPRDPRTTTARRARAAPDGWLLFSSRRAGWLGKDDIWRARRQMDDSWHAENANGREIGQMFLLMARAFSSRAMRTAADPANCSWRTTVAGWTGRQLDRAIKAAPGD